MKDKFGRDVESLRISVTDRCNFRCLYCMPQNPEWLPHDEILRFEEIVRIAKIFVRLGISKIRLTGGEPTVRRDLAELVRMIVGIPGVKDVSITTNGYFLDKIGKELLEAGVKRLNISLDTLSEEKFNKLTRTNNFKKVLENIFLAKQMGFNPIKLNTVVVRDYNEDEVAQFLDFCIDNGFQARFIEFMPLDGSGAWTIKRVVSKAQILKLIGSKYEVEQVSRAGKEPADLFRIRGTETEFGVIPSVSEPFCMNCNRVRLTADGKLRTCLFSIQESDIKTHLRTGRTDDEIFKLLAAVVYEKEKGHLINKPDFIKPPRMMYQIGG